MELQRVTELNLRASEREESSKVISEEMKIDFLCISPTKKRHSPSTDNRSHRSLENGLETDTQNTSSASDRRWTFSCTQTGIMFVFLPQRTEFGYTYLLSRLKHENEHELCSDSLPDRHSPRFDSLSASAIHPTRSSLSIRRLCHWVCLLVHKNVTI